MHTNLFLRIISLACLVEVFVCSFPNWLNTVYGTRPEAVTALYSLPLGEFVVGGVHASYCLALATIAGYAATFTAHKDKVKVVRGLWCSCLWMTYRTTKEWLDGDNDMFVNNTREIVLVVLFASLFVWSTLISFEIGHKENGGGPAKGTRASSRKQS